MTLTSWSFIRRAYLLEGTTPSDMSQRLPPRSSSARDREAFFLTLRDSLRLSPSLLLPAAMRALRGEGRDTGGERGETGERGERGETGERGERRERGERGERAEREERGERGERGERVEQAGRGERGERIERGERGERVERAEGAESFGGDGGERFGEAERGEGGDGKRLGERGERDLIGEEERHNLGTRESGTRRGLGKDEMHRANSNLEKLILLECVKLCLAENELMNFEEMFELYTLDKSRKSVEIERAWFAVLAGLALENERDVALGWMEWIQTRGGGGGVSACLLVGLACRAAPASSTNKTNHAVQVFLGNFQECFKLLSDWYSPLEVHGVDAYERNTLRNFMENVMKVFPLNAGSNHEANLSSQDEQVFKTCSNLLGLGFGVEETQQCEAFWQKRSAYPASFKALETLNHWGTASGFLIGLCCGPVAVERTCQMAFKCSANDLEYKSADAQSLTLSDVETIILIASIKQALMRNDSSLFEVPLKSKIMLDMEEFIRIAARYVATSRVVVGDVHIDALVFTSLQALVFIAKLSQPLALVVGNVVATAKDLKVDGNLFLDACTLRGEAVQLECLKLIFEISAALKTLKNLPKILIELQDQCFAFASQKIRRKAGGWGGVPTSSSYASEEWSSLTKTEALSCLKQMERLNLDDAETVLYIMQHAPESVAFAARDVLTVVDSASWATAALNNRSFLRFLFSTLSDTGAVLLERFISNKRPTLLWATLGPESSTLAREEIANALKECDESVVKFLLRAVDAEPQVLQACSDFNVYGALRAVLDATNDFLRSQPVYFELVSRLAVALCGEQFISMTLATLFAFPTVQERDAFWCAMAEATCSVEIDGQAAVDAQAVVIARGNCLRLFCLVGLPSLPTTLCNKLEARSMNWTESVYVNSKADYLKNWKSFVEAVTLGRKSGPHDFDVLNGLVLGIIGVVDFDEHPKDLLTLNLVQGMLALISRPGFGDQSETYLIDVLESLLVCLQQARHRKEAKEELDLDEASVFLAWCIVRLGVRAFHDSHARWECVRQELLPFACEVGLRKMEGATAASNTPENRFGLFASCCDVGFSTKIASRYSGLFKQILRVVYADIEDGRSLEFHLRMLRRALKSHATTIWEMGFVRLARNVKCVVQQPCRNEAWRASVEFVTGALKSLRGSVSSTKSADVEVWFETNAQDMQTILCSFQSGASIISTDVLNQMETIVEFVRVSLAADLPVLRQSMQFAKMMNDALYLISDLVEGAELMGANEDLGMLEEFEDHYRWIIAKAASGGAPPRQMSRLVQRARPCSKEEEDLAGISPSFVQAPGGGELSPRIGHRLAAHLLTDSPLTSPAKMVARGGEDAYSPQQRQSAVKQEPNVIMLSEFHVLIVRRIETLILELFLLFTDERVTPPVHVLAGRKSSIPFPLPDPAKKSRQPDVLTLMSLLRWIRLSAKRTRHFSKPVSSACGRLTCLVVLALVQGLTLTEYERERALRVGGTNVISLEDLRKTRAFLKRRLTASSTPALPVQVTPARGGVNLVASKEPKPALLISILRLLHDEQSVCADVLEVLIKDKLKPVLR